MSTEQVPATPKVSLQVLTADYNRLAALLIEAGGELSPELEAELTVTQDQLAAKADRYGFVLAKLDAEQLYWKGQADRFQRVARACGNAIERLRGNIKGAMLATGLSEIAGEVECFKLTASAPALKIDEAQLPKKYFIETVVRSPNKDKIKGDLKEGKTVKGAHFEEVKALRVSLARKVR